MLARICEMTRQVGGGTLCTEIMWDKWLGSGVKGRHLEIPSIILEVHNVVPPLHGA